MTYYEPFPGLRTRFFKQKLTSLGISIHTYTWNFFFHQSNVVYPKIPFQTGKRFGVPNAKWYIGSTSCGIVKREWNRLTKIRQLVEKQPIKAELAAQWWASNGQRKLWSSMPHLFFVGADSYRQACVLEHYIGLWQPRLNHPYITKFLKYKSHQLILTKKAQTTSRVSLGFRLLRKVRIRMHAQYKTKHVAALTSHLVLTFYGNSAVLPDNRLMHNGFCVQTILPMMMYTYALCRLCNHLEQPHRSQCMGELRKIMQFRNMTFSIVGMSPDHFCLVTPGVFWYVAKNGYVSTFWSTSPCVFPFHLPSGSIRESAHSIVFISFCGTTKKFNLCVVAFKFAISFRVSPRLVAMFLLPQNKLQRRFQVPWGFTFCTTVELQFFLIKSNISKRQSSSSFVGQSDTGSPSIGFQNSVFLSVRSGNCTWHM